MTDADRHSLPKPKFTINRRGLLTGAAVGGGLLAGWALWPREYLSDLPVMENERGFGLWLKIATNGTVILNVPQSEMGQGVFTRLAQIAAGELGADWRSMAIQPVAAQPAFANLLLAKEWADAMPSDQGRDLGALVRGDDALHDWAREAQLALTAGSSSIRMFEAPVRQAAAAARAMLSQAAAARWNVAWETLIAADGFIINPAEPDTGKSRLSFAKLVIKAAEMSPPDPAPLRALDEDVLVGRDVMRLDLPAKLDGSANFAADIRRPNMLYAALRMGPVGASLRKINTDQIRKRPEVEAVVEGDGWIAVAAQNWWAADKALGALNNVFQPAETPVSDDTISKAFVAALSGKDGVVFAQKGDAKAQEADKTTRVFSAYGRAHAAFHAPAETRAATAEWRGDKVAIWVASQAAEDARQRVARALGIAPANVLIHPVMAGGSFGRNFDNEIAVQAALIARQVKKPVQLMLSRMEDMRAGHVRAPARAVMRGTIDETGMLSALTFKLAMPSTLSEAMAKAAGHQSRMEAMQAAAQFDRVSAAGFIPPYDIAHLEVAHFPVATGVPTGRYRGNSETVGTFFLESFMDEMAKQSGREPLSFRMPLLAKNPRLARVLAEGARMADWNGGKLGEDGIAMGLATAQLRGGYIALVAELEAGEGRPSVKRLSAMVDAGRINNPDLTRQQIEGGLIFGLGDALGNRASFADGLPKQKRLADLNLPLLAETPEIRVEFIRSDEEEAGVGELGVPPVAPAIGNALAAATGKRQWNLPLFQ